MKHLAIKLHLWLGLASGLVVFIVALTGSMLAFRDELEPLTNARFFTVSSPTNGPRRPLDLLVATATAQFPGKPVSKVIVEDQPDRTVIVELKQSKKAKDVLAVALDPYTGRVVATRVEESAFFPTVLRLHRYLCLGETGKVITGISCSLFLVIMLTGLVLWWPNRKNRAQRFRIKWNASFKRLNWDLHAVVGFYVLPFIFLIASTGLIWSYKWVNNLLFLALDGKPQTKREAPANASAPGEAATGRLTQVLAQTDKQLPHPGRITLTFPETDSLSLTVAKVDETAAVSNIVDFLYFDLRTGLPTGQRLYDEETRGFKARRLIFPVHTGSMFGWPTKLIALLVALLTATLPLSGAYMWWQKRNRKSRPKPIRIRPQQIAPV
ncbi:PepSY-associated TM helix domain-containing protein [Spirosoma rhododendri]|uniref:PepSY domain-containing protein n=1 Tax=Spirosoma rhododendri TaxID=2728024 RepID=A0A7L5DLE5_9BACT|nr:PepSY-associated TM helix domain-containing protein [Spirosoma rhododendri]QJD77248.1 PepSY domain-containing protein [Spirosoma rhododendri]